MLSIALQSGLEITALHNAGSVGKVFAAVKQTSGGKGVVPRAEIDPAKTTLDAKKIDSVLGKPGEFSAGVYKVVVGRSTSMGGHSVGNAMGVNTWAAFAGSDDRAVVLRLCAFALSALLCVVGLTGCRSRSPEVIVYTSVDQVFSEPIFRTFERQGGIAVRAVYDTEETKSTGVVNRLIAEAVRPQADVFWSNDPVRQLLLAGRGLVAPYVSPRASGIPPEYRAADGSWTGLAARARIILANKKRVGNADVPRSILALADPRWRGQTAIANPLFGTTTMHVAALFTTWGKDKARAFMESLKANGVRVASSNGEVKRLVVSGEVAFGLCDTDDGDEALKEGAPVEVIFPDQDGMGTLVMPTTVVIVRGGPHPEAARRLVDYLLAAEVERAMAETASHMPLRPGVPTPPSVQPVSGIKAMQVDYRKVASEMERIQPWLRQWVGL